MLRQVTDPYLNLFRNLLPPIMGQIDFTPILGFMVLQFLARILSTDGRVWVSLNQDVHFQTNRKTRARNLCESFCAFLRFVSTRRVCFAVRFVLRCYNKNE